MSTNHTPEPWRIGHAGSVVSDHPVPEMGGSEAVDCYGGHMICESVVYRNARRIVACVNACAGMEDPEGEIAALRNGAKTNQLLAALLAVIEDYAKAKGGTQ